MFNHDNECYICTCDITCKLHCIDFVDLQICVTYET